MMGRRIEKKKGRYLGEDKEQIGKDNEIPKR